MIEYSGKVIIKKIYDFGQNINLEEVIKTLGENLNSKFQISSDQTLAMSFNTKNNPYNKQFPIFLTSKIKLDIGNYYLRVYPAGIIVLSLVQTFVNIKSLELKQELNTKMKQIDTDQQITYLLSEIAKELILEESLTQLRKNMKKTSDGISTVYIPDQLFENTKEFLNNKGAELLAHLFVKAPTNVDKLIVDFDNKHLFSKIEPRYLDELTLIGRHSIFLHANSRGEKFIKNSELVYEMARVQRFLIKMYGNILQEYNISLNKMISNQENDNSLIGAKIIEINLLRNEFYNTIPELSSYPSMITNIHFIRIYEEVLRIGYGNLELEKIEQNINKLDTISLNIYNIRNSMNDSMINNELNQLNLVFIIGVTAQLLSFLTQSVNIVISSAFFILASIIFGVGLYFSISRLNRKKFRKKMKAKPNLL
ncbi:MAG: hypothetical protein ACTSWW_06355 [Promethearchaeota archaeon]